jgi:ankyrin repeat protein
MYSKLMFIVLASSFSSPIVGMQWIKNVAHYFYNANNPIVTIIKDGNREPLKKLLDETLDVNYVDENHMSLLHHATAHGQLSIVQMLIDHGASVNCKEKDGFTPLHIACLLNNLLIMETLIRANAHINEGDKYKCTPLHYAAYNPNLSVTQLLVYYGAHINSPNQDDFRPLHFAWHAKNIPYMQFLVNNGADINCKGGRNQITPLHLACFYNDIEAVKLLLRSGADYTNVRFGEKHKNIKELCNIEGKRRQQEQEKFALFKTRLISYEKQNPDTFSYLAFIALQRK